MYVVRLLVLAAGVAYSARLPHAPIFTAVQHYPSICYLPPDSALCSSTVKEESDESNSTDLLVRYYFDIATEQCYPFGVQSCGGNENRFPSRADCLQYCKLVKKEAGL